MMALPHQVLRVDVNVPAVSGYHIHIGSGLLAQAGALVKRDLPGVNTAVIVTDQNVAPLYVEELIQSLRQENITVLTTVILSAGESAKSFESYQMIVNNILAANPQRQTMVVALGGGVVGDIAGFAAATVLRGLPFVQIPTTLLAQVDSSVGGKTAINAAQGKNMLGVFYQPHVVISDTDVLQTLPPREMKAGYAEIVKTALLADADFFSWLEKNGGDVLKGETSAVTEVIKRSCHIKAKIVAEDPLETTGQRVLLNLGHTFGHALEALGGYDGRLLHGEAVAIGLLWASAFSCQRGMISETDFIRVKSHLVQNGLVTHPPFDCRANDIIDKMKGDKKNTGAALTLVLLRSLGSAVVDTNINVEMVHRFLSNMLKGDDHV